MSAPLPRGTRRAYALLRRDVLRFRDGYSYGVDVAYRAVEFVAAMDKAMESARVRARRKR